MCCQDIVQCHPEFGLWCRLVQCNVLVYAHGCGRIRDQRRIIDNSSFDDGIIIKSICSFIFSIKKENFPIQMALSKAYQEALKQVIDASIQHSVVDPILVKDQPEGYTLNRGAYREVLLFSVTIEQPSREERILTNSQRRNQVIHEYYERERKFFNDGDCKSLTKLAKTWNTIKTSDGVVHSNYGYMVFHIRDAGNAVYAPGEPPISQWEWAKRRLLLCKDTNQAVMLFQRPWHQYTTNLDQPCTVNVQFFIRNNQLHLVANMRSNDVVFGTPYNWMYFVHLMYRMLDELVADAYPDLTIGNLTHRATSLHMYEKHLALVKCMLNGDPERIQREKELLARMERERYEAIAARHAEEELVRFERGRLEPIGFRTRMTHTYAWNGQYSVRPDEDQFYWPKRYLDQEFTNTQPVVDEEEKQREEGEHAPFSKCDKNWNGESFVLRHGAKDLVRVMDNQTFTNVQERVTKEDDEIWV